MKLDNVLRKSGFHRSKLDPCVYFRINGHRMIIVAIYVDDMLIFTNDTSLRDELKSTLMNEFKMKDLGEAKSCIGLHITRDKKNGVIYVDQQKYVNEILVKFGMADCKLSATPTDPNQKLSKDMEPKDAKQKKKMEDIPYREAVGSLLYLAQCSRPDCLLQLAVCRATITIQV